MAILLGALAARLLKREFANDENEIRIFKGVIAEVQNIDENRICYPKSQPEHDFVSVSVLAHDAALDAHPARTIMVSGMLERPRAGLELTENYIGFGDATSEAIRQEILAGAYKGRTLSSVIGTSFADHDPVLGDAYVRDIVGDEYVVIDLPVSYARYADADAIIEALRTAA